MLEVSSKRRRPRRAVYLGSMIADVVDRRRWEVSAACATRLNKHFVPKAYELRLEQAHCRGVSQCSTNWERHGNIQQRELRCGKLGIGTSYCETWHCNLIYSLRRDQHAINQCSREREPSMRAAKLGKGREDVLWCLKAAAVRM